MDIPQLPLNALRAFEAAARLESFTRAGFELHVSQTAVSHHVKALEDMLGVELFKRMPRGVTLTDEGEALLPVLNDAFRRMSTVLTQFRGGDFRQVLTVGMVSSFALGWFMPRLEAFKKAHPEIDLRIKTNNNRADFLGDGLDCFIRFGDGAWHGTAAERVLTPRFAPVCSKCLATDIHSPEHLASLPLLRSYRRDEWSAWFHAAGLDAPRPSGVMFDSSHALVEAASLGAGVALVPLDMFERQLAAQYVVQPLALSVDLGSYWITWLHSRRETAAMQVFRQWLLAGADTKRPAFNP
ncbi:LysR family transcriptional regulator of beta-lactamase [Roseibium hamelinense]|uniref:LysR family transcriptional regulator of beta-lactamase n=1 Tax=Roseibium hamelinense TaxID=150831 RepID=A0A562T9W6_9HYPH|nr:LysR family transcriptional regulator [Roseibium hamelinense]MTI45199.1 LysR family transcriptional regulator [Roseibium hamelinense]TWI90439.1 LysR family transcriptional regulator of beta-lactamase [Roseibium hamelinense]